MSRFTFNPYKTDSPHRGAPESYYLRETDMRDLHRALPGYAPTPLTKVPSLAEELGIGALSVKDESFRFGVKAFKTLGAT